MSPGVTRTSEGLVRPCAPTPSDTLPLSTFDKQYGLREMRDILSVYKQGHEPARVIREALSKALVHYYPLAGRLVDSSSELKVACTGDGAWFVEASADCSLRDVNYMERPLVISEDIILPHPRPNTDPNDHAIVMMQVTHFTCGGFTVAVLFNHAVMDGIGLGQFLGAVGEMARGLERPTVEPIWCRDAILVPLVQPLYPTPPPPEMNTTLNHATIDIPMNSINQLKSQYTKETGRRCSTFDIVVALIWKCRTMAISLDHHADDELVVEIFFPVNVRPLLGHVLPPGGGYYGNCFFIARATASSRTIVNAPVVEIVDLIIDAKRRVPAEFGKWVRGELNEEQHRMSTSIYLTLSLSDFSRVGISEVDYGWGASIYGSHFTLMGAYYPCCFINKAPAPKQGIRLATLCVREEHLASLHDEMMELLSAC